MEAFKCFEYTSTKKCKLKDPKNPKISIHLKKLNPLKVLEKY